MRNSTNLFTLAALSASLSTAYALDAPPSDVIRCLIVGSRLATAADAKQRIAGPMLAIYSMARLEEFSAKEIEDAMFNESYAMTPTDFQSEAGRCGKILVEKGQEMTQIGNNLVRRGQEMKDKPTTPPASTPNGAQPSGEKVSRDSTTTHE
jgi:hypothetical protein